MSAGIDRDMDITAEEVISAIYRLKTQKALGGSWVSADLLR